MNTDISNAVNILGQGGVVCHACEGVWGFACDPFNPTAVQKVLDLKRRKPNKGLIVIADKAERFQQELQQLPKDTQIEICESWPGHITWLLPNVQFSPFITGEHDTVATRVPAHKQALELSAQWGNPLVSTSANVEGEDPCQSETEVRNRFKDQVDYILSGSIGGEAGPSQIVDALTGARLR